MASENGVIGYEEGMRHSFTWRWLEWRIREVWTAEPTVQDNDYYSRPTITL